MVATPSQFPTDPPDPEISLQVARALYRVLARRTHRRKVMGQEVIVPGQLGEALRLPAIISQLGAKTASRREKGAEAFDALWQTLSSQTREKVWEELGWYDPRELDWEDPRANRRPVLRHDS